MDKYLEIGTVLNCKYRGPVIVIGLDGDSFTVLHKGKEYVQSYADLDKILFYNPSNKVSKPSQNEKIMVRCKDCNLIKTDECLGKESICSFFKPAFDLDESESGHWPKFGDATYFRLHGWY